MTIAKRSSLDLAGSQRASMAAHMQVPGSPRLIEITNGGFDEAMNRRVR